MATKSKAEGVAAAVKKTKSDTGGPVKPIRRRRIQLKVEATETETSAQTEADAKPKPKPKAKAKPKPKAKAKPRAKAKPKAKLKAKPKAKPKAKAKAKPKAKGEARPAPRSGQSGPTIELAVDSFNAKELAVLRLLNGEGAGIRPILPINEIAGTCFSTQSRSRGNSWTRNSLRRLVQSRFVERIERGKYRITESGRKSLVRAA